MATGTTVPSLLRSPTQFPAGSSLCPLRWMRTAGIAFAGMEFRIFCSPPKLCMTFSAASSNHRIWKWKGLHRIQTFMWLVAHGRLLTNSRRHKWSDTISPTCQACNSMEENQMHVLRDYIYATRVWLHLLPSSQVSPFFEANDTTWVFDNLDISKMSVQRYSWQTTFMVTTWFLWQWRNKSIFEE